MIESGANSALVGASRRDSRRLAGGNTPGANVPHECTPAGCRKSPRMTRSIARSRVAFRHPSRVRSLFGIGSGGGARSSLYPRLISAVPPGHGNIPAPLSITPTHGKPADFAPCRPPFRGKSAVVFSLFGILRWLSVTVYRELIPTSVRFDEGREAVGHWPSGLSIHRFPPTLHPVCGRLRSDRRG